MLRHTVLAALSLWTWCAHLSAAEAVIEVHADRPASYEVPRTIYGTFLEPIGKSVYGGLWAQILENPSLEENLWSANSIRRMLDAEPALARASQLGLPLPWEPLDAGQGARYEPRWGDAANGTRSLLLMGLPGKETGVRQQVYLPVHRCLRYSGSFYARRLEGAGEATVSLRRRNLPAGVLARQSVVLDRPAWTRYEFALALEAGEVAPLEPVDFVIALAGEGRVLLDQVFLVPADQVEGMDPEMIAMSRALSTPLVRFGGNFTSAYHWRDGVGPIDRRVGMLNLAWGMPEYNHFGTDEFLAFCRLIGAQPQIALNLGSGTPEEAAEWVRYVNGKWGASGLLWELGNELWGTFQTGYPTLERVAARTRAFSQAVRGADPSARLIATGQDPDHFEAWNAAQLSGAAGAFDYLATHFVVRNAPLERQNASPEEIARAAFALPVELERRLRAMARQIDGAEWARGRVKIAFTEWLFHGPEEGVPRFSNMGGAVATAGFLNMLLRTADIVPVSDMTGLVEFGGIWKKRGRVYGVPAYWAFRMYSTAGAVRPVETRNDAGTYEVAGGVPRLPSIAAVPWLDVAGALDASGRGLTLFCVNRHPDQPVTARLRISGFAAAPQGRAQVLAAPSLFAANDEAHPDAVKPAAAAFDPAQPFEFPPASVTRLDLTRR